MECSRLIVLFHSFVEYVLLYDRGREHLRDDIETERMQEIGSEWKRMNELMTKVQHVTMDRGKNVFALFQVIFEN